MAPQGGAVRSRARSARRECRCSRHARCRRAPTRPAPSGPRAGAGATARTRRAAAARPETCRATRHLGARGEQRLEQARRELGAGTPPLRDRRAAGALEEQDLATGVEQPRNAERGGAAANARWIARSRAKYQDHTLFALAMRFATTCTPASSPTSSADLRAGSAPVIRRPGQRATHAAAKSGSGSGAIADRDPIVTGDGGRRDPLVAEPAAAVAGGC